MDFNFSQAVLVWFQDHGRHDLPWQKNINAYRVWLSEVMLQQTQVATVIPYFKKFIEQFPTVQELAAAPIDQVLHLWTGLGYYARARNLHQCAQIVVRDYGGRFPKSVDALSELPGIGRSTAGAIASITWNHPAPILDGNVKRVLARFFAIGGWPGDGKVSQQLWELTEEVTPQENTGTYTQAIMDLGATVCTRSKPQCDACPLTSQCQAYAQGNQQDYPGKKSKKPLPVKQTQMLMLQNPDGEWLLEQRPPQGIWGGLWSFPELSLDQDSLQYCLNHYGEAEKLDTWAVMRHTFSHYHLDITPVCLKLNKAAPQIMADDRLIWYNTTTPATVGLAAPVKKLLGLLADQNQKLL